MDAKDKALAALETLRKKHVAKFSNDRGYVKKAAARIGCYAGTLQRHRILSRGISDTLAESLSRLAALDDPYKYKVEENIKLYNPPPL